QDDRDLLEKNRLALEQLKTNRFEGLETALKNYEIASDSEVSKEIKAQLLSTLALSYHTTGDYVNAAKHRLEAIDLFITLNDDEGLVNSYNLLGGIFYNIGDFDKTIKYTLLAIDVARRTNTIDDRAATLYNNLAGAYTALGEHKSALKYAKRVFDNNPTSRQDVYTASTISEIYLASNFCDSALYYLDLIADYENPANPNSSTYLSTFLALDYAQVYLCKQDTANGLAYARKAYHRSNKYRYTAKKLEATKLLNSIHFNQNRQDSALHYGRILLKLQDSVWSKEKENQLNRIIIDHHEAEIEAKDREAARQRLIITYSLVIGTISVLLLVVLFFVNR
ncbi:tetratricopeptide repeat protein, partial [Fulvivirga sp. RKSG066]|uniref:tetratricopeptide repeat protein n=1 Tax=Fulvivirga aurantia TaxID=2529383 RepID=UPI0012BD70C6